jgi:adenylate cyclase
LIDSQKEVLEPSVRQITVLFADIEGFTKLSTQISTQELAKITRQVLNILTNEVHAFEGTLDKYIGDAAMAIWNAPLDQRNHAELAVKSAISMVKKLEKYNLENPNQPTIQVRIGIHSGDAMVGDLGTKLRHTYTAIGDSVNIAHRLHEKSKDYGSFILISKDVFSQLENPLEESERIIRVAN